MDGAKKTKQAVAAAIWNYDRLLVLWRKKWESEGTPLIMPGGEVDGGEMLTQALQREVKEEIKINIFTDPCILTFMFVTRFQTEWTDDFNIAEIQVKWQPIIQCEPKFAGYIWLPINDDDLMRKYLPLCMPGLRKYLTEKLNFGQ